MLIRTDSVSRSRRSCFSLYSRMEAGNDIVFLFPVLSLLSPLINTFFSSHYPYRSGGIYYVYLYFVKYLEQYFIHTKSVYNFSLILINNKVEVGLIDFSTSLEVRVSIIAKFSPFPLFQLYLEIE